MKATLIPFAALPLLLLSCTGQQDNTVHIYHLKSSGPRAVPQKRKPIERKSAPAPVDNHFCVYLNDAVLKQNGAKHLEISLAAQRGIFYVNGQVAMDFPVCTGKIGYETPTGSYTIKEKKRHHRSNIYHVPMPCFMRLTYDGIGLHIGDIYRTPASHGCIRLPKEACLPIFHSVNPGTLVVIH